MDTAVGVDEASFDEDEDVAVLDEDFDPESAVFADLVEALDADVAAADVVAAFELAAGVADGVELFCDA